ncbi:MAG: hypothetical protein F4004_11710 [Acidimicrobiia bacterium]|nr:hypothetical protein [Acidimicrobiia bacterium]MYC46287.1 hypothetical protein [Acidimicrobiia bacterium]
MWCARGADLAPDAAALSPAADRLDEIFERAQEQGLLGRATAPRQEWMHAAALARQLTDPGEGRCLDLGTGAGLPGLVMATCWSATRWLLTDRRLRSENFVRWAIGVLDMGERVSFRRGEAAELAREETLAGGFALVAARAFGPPPLTAECATGFLALGGRLVVSEPEHEAATRWPSAPLRRLGLAMYTTGTEPRFVELRKVTPHEDRFPRRPAAMQRDPLY